MLTYWIWKEAIEEHIIFWDDFDAMSDYAWCTFASIFTIIIDIVTLPCQAIGLIVWLITRRNR